MIDVERTIISQYANSPTLSALIQNFNDYIDPRGNFDDFYAYVWNIETAQGFGLDIWGRIVNVSRLLRLPDNLNKFGFKQGGAGSFPFNVRPFRNGANGTKVYELSDESYRKLILVKALSNISFPTIPFLNKILMELFGGSGRECYAHRIAPMSLIYTFNFQLSAIEFAILIQSGALPRPSGVFVEMFRTRANTFGFKNNGLPFNQGAFRKGDIHAIV